MDAAKQAVYPDRQDAGRRLAARLERFRREAPVVLALPRGGVPVAVEVAASLAAPLDVLPVRKLGESGARVGAVAEGGLAIVDHDAAQAHGLSAEALATLREQATAEVEADARRLRAGSPRREIVGRTVLLVDDGVGTGNSALAAARTARRRGAARIVLAVPVAGAAVLARLGEELDEIVCVKVAPAARWYEHAAAVSDAVIVDALRDRELRLGSELHVPEAARGLIVLATAGEVVRRTFGERGFATFELGPAAAEREFAQATERLRRLPAARLLGLGYFGLGGGAEAALLAAGRPDVRAIVAVGGRPDRPGVRLETVTAPCLLVVGGEDRIVVRLAREACKRLGAAERQVAVVAGASHDFAEPGAREQVAHLAGGWFARYL